MPGEILPDDVLQHLALGHSEVVGGREIQEPSAEPVAPRADLMLSVHLRTLLRGSEHSGPHRSGIRPRFQISYHILVNCLTFPES